MQIEHTEGKLEKTDVTEMQILREHSDYLSVIAVHKDTVFSASGDQNIWLHRQVIDIIQHVRIHLNCLVLDFQLVSNTMTC